MQIALMAILFFLLASAVMSFFVMGWRRVSRARVLSRHCNERTLHFFRDDPFDIPHRYREFALLANGHSPRATNVSHGNVGQHAVRAFDYQYEVGHGTRRLSLAYGVILVETRLESQDVLMWNDADIDHAPLTLRPADGHLGYWTYHGEESIARSLADGAEEFGTEGVSMELHDGILLLAMPARQGRWDYTTWIHRAMVVPVSLAEGMLTASEADKAVAKPPEA